jgi:NTP pyrophosphatase (non-canonical NTP hydrolase)|tara:strand:- start:135 stop:479 length:345 start_codon:yes stop_codon:yes gene_type:complete
VYKGLVVVYIKMASLNYYKHETEKICKTKGWDRVEINTVWLLLTEEFGELASAIRQYKKTFKKTNIKKDKGVDIMMEMGDVFSYLFQLAHMLNIDLDKMWLEHGKKMTHKKYIS